MIDKELSLRLIGYYRCAAHGFAMPLYGQREGANTLYIARAAVSGDHSAKIVSFEPIDVDDRHRLPADESIVVNVGEPWRDVFLWNGAAYVGTPEQLWNELGSLQPDVEARAPLSLLDLAVHARRDEVSTLAGVAFRFLQTRFGDTKARSWRQQFVRQQTEVALRRVLADPKLDDRLFQAVHIREATANVLTLDLPEEFASISVGEEVRSVIADVSQMAVFLGASLAPLPIEESATARRNISQPAPPVETVLEEISVLILADGKRAKQVVRHLQSGSERDPDLGKLDWEISSGGTSKFLSSGAAHTRSVIALVLSEDENAPALVSPEVELFLEKQATTGALILLVPALPATRPSMLLDPNSGWRLPVAHAVLDTTIARSPFWWGNIKRSFDRRISDVVRLAVSAARSPVVRRELLEPRSEEAVPILSVGMVSNPGDRTPKGNGTEGGLLGSEASCVSSDPKRSDPAILFSVRINTDEIDGYRNSSQIIIEGRRRENKFPEFASSVIAPLFGRGNRRSNGLKGRLEQLSDLPSSIRKTLRAPDYVSAFANGSESHGFRLAVTAETPSLDTVEQADHMGWNITRYTDTVTMKRLSEGMEPTATFPDEILMGSIQSREINRNLATRGVDQRDVVRISYDLLSEWLDEVPATQRAAASRNARPQRSATRPYSDSEDTHLLLREYVLSSDPAAQRLLSLISSKKKPALSGPMKRSADLEKCWNPPLPGFRRYGIVDGAVPGIVLELSPEEVPMQDLFVVDGDYAVPALFRSRVFAVWARATLPAASSWMARFSVANTFGGFPIADTFRIVEQGSGAATALVTEDASSRLVELAEEVGQYIERALASLPLGSWKEAHRPSDNLPAMGPLNDLVLQAYGLPEHATDIQILRRLKEMNSEFDKRS
ncbi:hypothetical protein [uncultured Roseibium sp.]|uniref:hypothetical protein n=1 Tax=uncultured Roseibium sp. TaxID=1936171 RepID=UPI002634F353|nr:hypothetical protein [uncultured Roseibium sp.]